MARKSKADLIKDIMTAAENHVKTTGGDEDKLFALLGTVPPAAPTFTVEFTKKTVTFDADDLKDRGKEIFEKFKKYLKIAVCDDFDYCSKKAAVDKNLKQYLPQIINLLLKRIPMSGKLPAWLVTVLAWIGIPAASLEVVLAILVAWLIIQGCNVLCQCKS
jgi:hypothetical protein